MVVVGRVETVRVQDRLSRKVTRTNINICFLFELHFTTPNTVAQCDFRCSLILSRDSEASFYDGCAIATVGGASVMATVVGHPVTESTSCPSLPLAVGYRHAYDRIPINQKSLSVAEYETITAGVIERSLRPLFTRPYHFDTQVTLICPAFIR